MAKPYQIKLRRTTQTIDTASDNWTVPNWWTSAQGGGRPVDGEPIYIKSGEDRLLAFGDGSANKPKFFKAFKSTLLPKFTFWKTGTLTSSTTTHDLIDESNNKLFPTTDSRAVYYDSSVNNYSANTVGKAIKDAETNISTLTTNLANRPKMWYGTCTTAVGTAAKTITAANLTGGTFTSADLVKGCMVRVLFTNGNSNASATLNINSTGAKAIFRANAQMGAYFIGVNEVVDFVYDGTQFQIVSKGTATTSYYGVTKLSNTYTSSDETVAATQKSVYDVYTLYNNNAVKTSGNQTSIAGNKTFTGTVKVPTATAGTNDTTVATTAFVNSAVSSAIAGVQIAPYIGSSAPSNRNLLWVKTVSATVNGTAVTEYILHVCTNPTSTATATWVPVSSIW